MEKKTRYRLRRSQFHHQEQKHLILITCWSWRVLANSSIQITSLNPYSSHFIRVTIISIIKDETADAGDVSLLIQDHTENKRLSQKRIPSLLVAKNPSIASHGKPRQGERSPEEGRKPQRWSSDLETTKYPPKTHPSVARQGALRRMDKIAQPPDRGSLEGQYACRVSAWPSTCLRAGTWELLSSE